MRQPRWRRGLKAKSMLSFNGAPSSDRWPGILLCLLGGGLILAALPGWVYLLFVGAAVLYGGMLKLR